MLEQPPDIRPAPPDAFDRLSTEKIEAGIASRLRESDLDELRAGRVRWMLEDRASWSSSSGVGVPS